MNRAGTLTGIITASAPEIRNRSLDAFCRAASLEELREECRLLETFRHTSDSLYERVRACFFLQFGYLGEDWSDIDQTIQMVRQTQPDDVGVSVSYPLPGTKFHQIVSAQLGVKQNWSDSADLSMMFRGAYPTEFYRALTEAVHLEVRGGDGLKAAWRRVRELEQSAERRGNAA